MSQPSRDGPPMKIGYVVKRYPRLSETFILDEILGLEDAGLEVAIHSLLQPNDGRFHEDISRVKAVARYLPTAAQSVFGAFRALRDVGISKDAAALDRAIAFLEQVPEQRRGTLLVQALHLADEARKKGLEHLHAHFMSSPAQTTYLAHLFSGIPFSVTAHAVDIYGPNVDPAVVREIAEGAVAVVTVCEANRDHLRDLVGASSRIEVIYNGVSLDELSGNGLRDPGLVLAVGRLVEKKGYHILLEACRLLRDRDVEFRCVLVGDGKQREELLDQRRMLEIDDCVEMPGATSRREVLRWMRRARVFAAPCVTAADGNQDALPTVLLEALSIGLPVVSTPVAGIPEIVDDGVEGLLTPPGDAAALADAVQCLLTDDGVWARMAAAGPAKAADRFDRTKNLPKLIELFRQSARGRVLEAVQ
ncbi:MAG TPA: glycosyltransferase [Actinomycetota bacterium]|nr:glycosyltransferase [Actinomycetota bacterium]